MLHFERAIAEAGHLRHEADAGAVGGHTVGVFALLIVGSVYAFLVGLVSFSLFFYALKRLRVAKAATLAYVEVVCALILAYLFFNEIPTWNKLAGGALILTAASLVRK